MLLIFLDTEMTGLNPQKHRAIEIAFKIVDADSFQTLLTYETLISQPLEIWAYADPKSLEINQLKYEDILQGKSEKVVESEITLSFNSVKISEKTGCFICQNPSLDRMFFNQIVSSELQEQYRWPYHWLDLASMYWAYRHFFGEEKIHFTERDLCKDRIAAYFNLPSEKHPHRAINGVNHLIACYQKIFLSQSFPH